MIFSLNIVQLKALIFPSGKPSSLKSTTVIFIIRSFSRDPETRQINSFKSFSSDPFGKAIKFDGFLSMQYDFVKFEYSNIVKLCKKQEHYNCQSGTFSSKDFSFFFLNKRKIELPLTFSLSVTVR